MSRPRVLIIAEAANPDWVSVPLIGWSLTEALRDVAEVHLATQARNRAAIEARGWVSGRDVTFIDSEAFARPIWQIGEVLRMGQGKGWTMVQAMNALSYPYFEWLVWRAFEAQIAAGEWDIVHRVTPLSPTIPSPIAPKIARTGTPFVLGPLNGGVPWPREFDAERRREREYLSYLRGAYKLLPGRGRTLKAATAILAGSRYTASEVPNAYQDKVVYLPENGIDPRRFTQSPADRGPVLRVAFVGRLVPYKGADMLLAAADPLIERGEIQIDIIGDGPQMAHLKTLAADRRSVTFHGWQSHDAVQNILSKAHLLGFPSIREFGGGVVLEAMALGVPPLVVDYAGPGELVTPETGLKIPLGSRAAIIKSLRETLRTLAADPALLAPLGHAARARVADQFTWPQKARQIARVYEWVLNGGEKPSCL